MKAVVRILVVVGFAVAVQSCFLFPFNGPDPEYHLTMYVSLGLFSEYPDDPAYDGGTIEGLANYGGKSVVFEVAGIQSLNDSINIVATQEMGWTGGEIESSTQYASYTADISENTMYLGGTYRFRMYIDWDDSGSLSSGDIVFDSYNVHADTDGDPGTDSLIVNPSEYGSAVLFDTADHSVDIVDPLTTDAGLPWLITAIDAGPLAVQP